MPNLQDILELAKADGGKFFIMDEEGNVKLVIMGIDGYRQLLGGRKQKPERAAEEVNREILKAQLLETAGAAEDQLPQMGRPVSLPAANDLLRTVIVSESPRARQPDLREEVIDPSFDFEAPRPEVEEF